MLTFSSQAILRTVDCIGIEDAVDLYQLALPLLKARLQTMQSAKSAEDAAIEARKLISSVLIVGSESLQKLLTDLRNENYSEQQLPQMINAMCRELRNSIREISDWVQTNQRMGKKALRKMPKERTFNQDFTGAKKGRMLMHPPLEMSPISITKAIENMQKTIYVGSNLFSNY